MNNKGLTKFLLSFFREILVWQFYRFIILLGLIIPILLAFYFGQDIIVHILVFALSLCFFVFTILLLTNKLVSVLNDFWKSMVLYNLYYKSKYSRLLFGLLYLVISIMILILLVKRILNVGNGSTF